MRSVAPLAVAVVLAAIAVPASAPLARDYDPLAFALASKGGDVLVERQVPAHCYASTEGGANPCWTCHTEPIGDNHLSDADLQDDLSFSDVARVNPWTNLFADWRAAIAAQGDDEILAYVRTDNYAPLAAALRRRTAYRGFVPDLDFAQGFDERGFARDKSHWRALRYVPLPAFWPTNGVAGEVFVRLPRPFWTDAEGREAQDVYEENLAILERAFDGASPPLPARYVGGARDIAVRRFHVPEGTELLHPVRYLDPDAPTFMATRMKELRYMRKVRDPDDWANTRAYERARDEKDEQHRPVFAGTAEVGLLTPFGWQLQGFIEDAEGRLRLQTEEEHRFCMGCHSAVGVTVDHTFSMARKVPGDDGWRPQDLRGLPNVPEIGHADPEALVYMRRARGADPFRANDEMLARYFPGGALDEARVRAAADLAEIVLPTRARALALNKAYRALVRSQWFDHGRDALLAPAEHALVRVDAESTGLREQGRTYTDARLHLAWGAAPR